MSTVAAIVKPVPMESSVFPINTFTLPEALVKSDTVPSVLAGTVALSTVRSTEIDSSRAFKAA